jgi:ABC-2 type transport system ATP-binding protein
VTLELTSVAAPPLAGLSLALGPGLHVLLGTPEDGAAEAIALAAGVHRPRGGRVRLAGADPYRSPALRTRIGALLGLEDPVAGRRVSDGVARALEARGARLRASEALAAVGLAKWEARRVRELALSEHRSVALAIALSVSEPVLLSLHEPLAFTSGLSRTRVVEALKARAAAGAIVLAATASARDAVELGGNVSVLDRGRLLGKASASLPSDLVVSERVELWVRADRARELAALLAAEPAVMAADWDDRDGSGQLRLRGSDLEALALAVLRTGRRASIRIHALSPAAPSLRDVALSSAALARAAYDEAYRIAALRARADAPPSPGGGG